jgi:hypothetical protein
MDAAWTLSLDSTLDWIKKQYCQITGVNFRIFLLYVMLFQTSDTFRKEFIPS